MRRCGPGRLPAERCSPPPDPSRCTVAGFSQSTRTPNRSRSTNGSASSRTGPSRIRGGRIRACSSAKKDMAASSDSTTMPTLSIRLTVIDALPFRRSGIPAGRPGKPTTVHPSSSISISTLVADPVRSVSPRAPPRQIAIAPDPSVPTCVRHRSPRSLV